MFEGLWLQMWNLMKMQMYWFCIGHQHDVDLLVWINTKSSIKNLATFLQHLKQICFVLCIAMGQLVYVIRKFCQFVFGIKNFSGVDLQPILSKEFIFCLYEEHALHGINVIGILAVHNGIEQLNHSIICLSIIEIDSCFWEEISAKDDGVHC